MIIIDQNESMAYNFDNVICIFKDQMHLESKQKDVYEIKLQLTNLNTFVTIGDYDNLEDRDKVFMIISKLLGKSDIEYITLPENNHEFLNKEYFPAFSAL